MREQTRPVEQIKRVLDRIQTLQEALKMEEGEQDLLDTDLMRQAQTTLGDYEHCLLWVLKKRGYLGVE